MNITITKETIWDITKFIIGIATISVMLAFAIASVQFFCNW